MRSGKDPARRLFHNQGTLLPDVTTAYRGIFPLFILQFIGLLICVAFPGLMTFLPGVMGGRGLRKRIAGAGQIVDGGGRAGMACHSEEH